MFYYKKLQRLHTPKTSDPLPLCPRLKRTTKYGVKLQNRIFFPSRLTYIEY